MINTKTSVFWSYSHCPVDARCGCSLDFVCQILPISPQCALLPSSQGCRQMALLFLISNGWEHFWPALKNIVDWNTTHTSAFSEVFDYYFLQICSCFFLHRHYSVRYIDYFYFFLICSFPRSRVTQIARESISIDMNVDEFASLEDINH